MNSEPPSDPVDKVLTRVEAPRANGAGWSARCPAHDDEHPSLSISEGENGRALVYCHAGCSHEAIVEAMGLWSSDLMPSDQIAASRGTCTQRAIDVTYDYCDEAGQLLYQVVRFKPKDFRQRRPDGCGGWIWNLGDTRRVLYRLPDLLNADPEAFIFVCEGEKDADNLANRGLIATTCPMGAGKWSQVEDAPLEGRHVVLVPDNDEQGERHAHEVGAGLHGRAATVRVLWLPDLQDKGDVSDWLAGGCDVEELVRQAEQCQEWEASEPCRAGLIRDPVKEAQMVEEGHQSAGGRTSSLIVRRAADIGIRDVEWYWFNRLVANGINLLCGMPEAGKSILTAYFAANTTRGGKWPQIDDEPVARAQQGDVAFLSMEDSPEMTIVPRLQAAGADLEKVHIVEGVRTGHGEKESRDAFDIRSDVDKLEELRQMLGDLELVVIDPLDSYMDAKLDTNVGNKVRAALWPLKDWCEQAGVTAIVVHHFNKTATTNAMDKVSGARSFGALPRAVWTAAKDEENENRVVLAPVKLNLVPASEKKAIAYTLQPSLNNASIPSIVWERDSVEISASELLGGSRNKTDEAADWLREVLADGPMETTAVLKLARQAGHAESTVRSAKKRIGVVAEQIRENNKVAGWEWKLP
jgi:hypothetical protein